MTIAMRLRGVYSRNVFTLAFFLMICLRSSSHASKVIENYEVDQRSNGFTTGELITSSASGEAARSLRRVISRLHAQHNPRVTMTCNHFPRICRAMGSPGPHCCKKQCVNVMTDGRNCGQCGKKCKYGEACCRGNCINIMYDRKNCGGCHKGCKKGSYCRYRMCSYA